MAVQEPIATPIGAKSAAPFVPSEEPRNCKTADSRPIRFWRHPIKTMQGWFRRRTA
jgi:hypothetical protein